MILWSETPCFETLKNVISIQIQWKLENEAFCTIKVSRKRSIHCHSPFHGLNTRYFAFWIIESMTMNHTLFWVQWTLSDDAKIDKMSIQSPPNSKYDLFPNHNANRQKVESLQNMESHKMESMSFQDTVWTVMDPMDCIAISESTETRSVSLKIKSIH